MVESPIQIRHQLQQRPYVRKQRVISHLDWCRIRQLNYYGPLHIQLANSQYHILQTDLQGNLQLLFHVHLPI